MNCPSEVNLPVCFSIRSWVSSSQLKQATEYATLWSCTPDGARRLGQLAADNTNSNSIPLNSRRAHSTGCLPVFSPAQYNAYAEVLDTLLSRVVSNPSRLGSHWTSEVLQERFGYTRGNALHRQWVEEPHRYVEKVVSCVATAIQEQFVLPYCCQTSGHGGTRAPFSLDDFDIHIQWRPRRIQSVSHRSTSRDLQELSSHSDHIAATVTIRYTPQVEAREEALRLVELSMASTKAVGQTLQSSLAFWDLVHSEGNEGNSSSKGTATRKRTRQEELDFLQENSHPMVTLENKSISSTSADEGGSSSEQSAESMWRSLLQRINGIPMVEPPLMRRILRETLLDSSEEDNESDENEEEKMLSQEPCDERYIRVPVVTSLPSESETVCTLTPLTNLIETQSSPSSSYKRIGDSATLKKARAIWRRVRRGGSSAFWNSRGAGDEEEDLSDTENEDVGVRAFRIPTVLGSWRSVQQFEQRKLSWNGAASVSDVAEESDVPHATLTKPRSQEQGLKNGTEASMTVSAGAMQVLLSKLRRRWEGNVLRGSSCKVSQNIYFAPVCAQPDELNLHNSPPSAIVKALPSLSSHHRNKAKKAFNRPTGMWQWGLPQYALLSSSPPPRTSTTRAANSSAGGAGVPLPRSRCGLVAQLSVSLNGMVYVGYPAPFCANAYSINAVRTSSATADTFSVPFARTLSNSEQPKGTTAPQSEKRKTAILPMSYLQLEDSKSFTRGILGLS